MYWKTLSLVCPLRNHVTSLLSHQPLSAFKDGEYRERGLWAITTLRRTWGQNLYLQNSPNSHNVYRQNTDHAQLPDGQYKAPISGLLQTYWKIFYTVIYYRARMIMGDSFFKLRWFFAEHAAMNCHQTTKWRRNWTTRGVTSHLSWQNEAPGYLWRSCFIGALKRLERSSSNFSLQLSCHLDWWWEI